MEKNKVVERIIKEELKVESSVKSIESLFENKRLRNKTNYTPYYQRNYVWDKQKATYFIESIFVGTEIPPLVFFNDGNSVEVIDGRQRYETIRKFVDVDFSLVKGGLDTLNFLSKKNFNDLSPELKEIFRTTKLRIIEFSIVNLEGSDEHDIDLVKKEIFRRYNSGITPLRKPEIEKAVYIHDDISSSFKSLFRSDKGFYIDVINLLFGKRDIDRIEDVYTIERVLTKIRQLLVVSRIPVKRLSSKGQSLVGKFYNLLMEENVDPELLINDFRDNILFLRSLKNSFSPIFLDKPNVYLLFETVYWALSILREERSLSREEWNNFPFNEFAEYLGTGEEHFSSDNPMFYKIMNDRYKFVSNYFKKKYKVNFDLYIETSYKTDVNVLSGSEIVADIEKLKSVRINKPEPSSETIEDVCKKIGRERFLIRPPYQRMEVINRKKSSSLIESILLGVKIPPIFLFKRADGISEVVDGQQRLLSIIGFLGEEFLDEEGSLAKSSKNCFKLNGLKVLSELNGLRYDELNEKMQGKILDFNIPMVTIDETLNINFDPIDLFIRLNNKPYPIRDDSFEMWNSYIDKDFISLVKDNVKKHSGWFYLRSPEKNSRMDNEQCYTQLIFLFYKSFSSDSDDHIKFYKRSNSISSRMKDKSEITRTLEMLSNDNDVKELFYRSIDKVEGFILLVKDIISYGKQDVPDEYLKIQFGELMNLKSNRRTMQGFYLLWYILHEARADFVSKDVGELNTRIKYIVSLTKDLSDDYDDYDEVKNESDDYDLTAFKNEIVNLQDELLNV